ncbi:hypothetical protein HK405_011161, partial [Cladochytrium tenue]
MQEGLTKLKHYYTATDESKHCTLATVLDPTIQDHLWNKWACKLAACEAFNCYAEAYLKNLEQPATLLVPVVGPADVEPAEDDAIAAYLDCSQEQSLPCQTVTSMCEGEQSCYL